MNFTPNQVVVIVLVGYWLGYVFYSKFLSNKIFVLRHNVKTPAHKKNDGIDYVPTKSYILWGHHYASIAGLGPILGPVIAVIWGWGPALIWVVLGSIFIGAVHDLAALVLSVRSQGYSLGTITEYLLGKRAKFLFLVIIFFLVSLAMGVFTIVIGKLISPSGGYFQVVSPSMLILLIALLLGYLSYKKNITHIILPIMAFLLVLVCVWYSTPISNMIHLESSFIQQATFWKSSILLYAFLASILPVWLLLQSRDFLNSMLLILGLVVLYLGFFYTPNKVFQAPFFVANPTNAPPVFPFVFVVIACGAISGFHGLVSSGTTAKQLYKETDARKIGYGGTLGESLLGLIAILATTIAFSSQESWNTQYSDYAALGLTQKVKFFIDGGSHFLSTLKIPKEIASSFVAFILVSFALTSLDSGTRLLRYNIEELFSFINVKKIRYLFQNRFASSFLAVSAIGFFAFFTIENKPVGMSLWSLFGTTNQLLGALTLLLASVYLFSRNKDARYTLIPMLFLLVATVYGIIYHIIESHHNQHTLLMMINIIILIIATWLIIETIISIKKYKKNKIKSLDILNKYNSY